MGTGQVSVIVVNWNGIAYLAECLDSVRRQSFSSTEVIVVDNGSTDGSREWLRDAARNGPCFQFIDLGCNRGFSGGVNAGICEASGEFVALLNNDAVADPYWLRYLVASMVDPAVGMAASKILFYDRRNIIDKAGHLFYPDGLNRGRGAGEVDRGQFDRVEEVLFPDGCAALYRVRMLEEIGLFDEQLFAYGDDADLGLRARWQGWKCVYAPEARVYHRHSSSLGKYSPQKAFFVERNRFWVALKLLPWPLLLASPVLTLWRFAWHIRSMLSARGLAGGVARDYSAWSLFRALVRAYCSGIAGSVAVLKKRRQVFRNRKLSSAQFCELLYRYRISARELALRD
jgi:GT2 family glycosyltransferase